MFPIITISVKAAESTLTEAINRPVGHLIDEIKKSGTENLLEPFVYLTIFIDALASYLGTISETISRAMKKLRDNKIIRMHGKTIFIENLNELKKLAV